MREGSPAVRECEGSSGGVVGLAIVPLQGLSKTGFCWEVGMSVAEIMSSEPERPMGDPTAAQQRFLSLFLRSEREIYRYVAALVPNPTDAQDIVQQTAVSLWEKFDAYDPALPFTPWACRFALNKTRQWVERRQRWQALPREAAWTSRPRWQLTQAVGSFAKGAAATRWQARQESPARRLLIALRA